MAEQTDKELMDKMVSLFQKGKIGDANFEELMAAFCKKEDDMAEQTQKRLVSDLLETMAIRDADIDIVIYNLVEYQKKYSQKYERLSVTNEQDEYEDYWYVKIFGWREETEHERNRRIQDAVISNSVEYQQYLKLKEKFEK